ncbi:SDR family oxidoreductase [Spirosoma koreense]
MRKALVIGGSGVLGSAVVNELRKHPVDFLTGSRQPIKTDSYSLVGQPAGIPWTRMDARTGEGLTAALAGIDTVFLLASSPGRIGREPVETVITRNVLTAMNRSEVNHLIYVSIVGVDKIPYRYYQAKRAAEVLIRQAQVPYTILRATQFHNLIDFALGKLMSLPIGFIPKKLLVQPIHVRAVAQELYRLAQDGPQQSILNLGGPQVQDVGTLVRSWMQYRPFTKPIVPIPAIGSLMHAFARGDNTCSEMAAGSETWVDYLRERYAT